MQSKKIVVAAALLLSSFALRADDKTEVKDEKVVVREVKEESSDCDRCSGNKFFRFWTHTVGGTIGGGLKDGAGKIHHGIKI